MVHKLVHFDRQLTELAVDSLPHTPLQMRLEQSPLKGDLTVLAWNHCMLISVLLRIPPVDHFWTELALHEVSITVSLMGGELLCGDGFEAE